jgi:uncharacterized protein
MARKSNSVTPFAVRLPATLLTCGARTLDMLTFAQVLSTPAWWMTALAVLCASALQTATGAGLGLVAAPVLLLALQSTEAVHVAVILNLTLSLALLPSERHQVPVRPLLALTGAALAGIPLGAWLLHSVGVRTLTLLAGVTVLLGAAQLLIQRRDQPAGNPNVTLGIAGTLAGLMTGALAIPGPAALWGLARIGLPAMSVRAVLRAFFALVYSVTLIVSASLGIEWALVLTTTAWMLPSLIAGAGLGVWLKRRASEAALRTAFITLLIVMGAALVVDYLV